MQFLDREQETARLDRLLESRSGGLAVVYGRRRVGKTRLLLEWCRRWSGVYTVADESSSELQRRYFADAVSRRFEGFAEVRYPDWASLLVRLTREARAVGWRGPLVIDELPYLVGSSPELPSVLQRWLDHEAGPAGMVVAVAGSSQRMMDGIVLSAGAPLYGRARELLRVEPLAPAHLADAFDTSSARDLVALYAAWGGVPRYWELASELEGPLERRVDALVLDPLGPLHEEPSRLLIEEMPPATEVRPLLDAIGLGAHRLSEVAGRIGRPATSLSRPLKRLTALGLARREVPFGESEVGSKRGLYRIADPFVRLWFRVVAPYRSLLASSGRDERLTLLGRHWPGLAAAAWEDLCRSAWIGASLGTALGPGPWKPAARWWRGNAPEWDLVSTSFDGEHVVLGEAKWRDRPVPRAELERLAGALGQRPIDALPAPLRRAGTLTRVLFVPETEDPDARQVGGVRVVCAAEVLGLAVPLAG